MAKKKSDHLHGTLELLILRLIEREPMNGYAIGQRMRTVTDEALIVDEGSLYPALYRLERRGLLTSSWGRSPNNRRAKFYRITALGRRQLGLEVANWTGFSDAVTKVLGSA